MASTVLTRTPSGAGNRKTFTWSFWFKRTKIGVESALFCHGANAGSDMCMLRFDPDVLNLHNGGSNAAFSTNAKYRDVNGWFHVVLRMDTTQATNTDRMKLYINGVQETSFSSITYPNQNEDTDCNTTSTLYIGERPDDNKHFDGIMSHVHFCDGYSYGADSFGETDATTGEWKIKTSPSVSYGTNGFFILKDGNSVTDQSPNSNNFTVAGGTLTKTEDNPSNVFATLNRLNTNNGSNTFANGNTKTTVSGNWLGISSTIAVNSGKYYWEIQNSGGGNFGAGIGKEGVNGTSTSYFSTANNWLFDQSTNYGYYRNGSGTTKANNSSTTTYGTTVASGDILMLAWDADNGKLFAGRNGTWFDSSDPANGTSPMYTITTGTDFWCPIFVAENNNILVNFGNGYFGTTAVASAGTNASNLGIFEYDVPTGYTALCTKGLNE